MTIWRHIWTTNIILKIKNFAWNLLTNSLVVRVNLMRRKMNVSPSYPLCGLDEDTEHMLYRCRWTDAVWSGILGLDGDHKKRDSIQSWIIDRKDEAAADQATKERRWQLCL